MFLDLAPVGKGGEGKGDTRSPHTQKSHQSCMIKLLTKHVEDSPTAVIISQ